MRKERYLVKILCLKIQVALAFPHLANSFPWQAPSIPQQCYIHSMQNQEFVSQGELCHFGIFTTDRPVNFYRNSDRTLTNLACCKWINLYIR